MNAEGDAVMMKLNLGPVADTIWNVAEQALKLKCDLTIAMQFVRTRSAHQTEYTMLASRTALRMIVVTPATSRMESCRGSNAMLVLLVPASIRL